MVVSGSAMAGQHDGANISAAIVRLITRADMLGSPEMRLVIHASPQLRRAAGGHDCACRSIILGARQVLHEAEIIISRAFVQRRSFMDGELIACGADSLDRGVRSRGLDRRQLALGRFSVA
jgi:hypothetical protein